MPWMRWIAFIGGCWGLSTSIRPRARHVQLLSFRTDWKSLHFRTRAEVANSFSSVSSALFDCSGGDGIIDGRELSRRCVLGLVGGFQTSCALTGILSTISPTAVHATTKDPRTGIVLPSIGEIEGAVPEAWDDDDNPFPESESRQQFSRLDATSDSVFYTDPRFVEHVDENAVQTMTSYISNDLLRNNDMTVLDLCSSWTSHISNDARRRLRRVSGLGMNAKELESNTVLDDWVVMDLNADPKLSLPYESSTFDVVMCQLSIDYLIYPLQVLKEVSRVLKPGGRVSILFSNRVFITKAVGLWTGADDIDHAYTVSAYLHYCGGHFVDINARDLSSRKGRGSSSPITGDPVYVITATKAS